MEKLLLKLPEAMEITGLGRTTLYGLINEGALPAIKIGRSLRIPASELDRFIDRLKVEQSAERD